MTDLLAIPLDNKAARLAAAYEQAKAAVKAAKEEQDSLGAALKAHVEELRVAQGYDPDTKVVLEGNGVLVRVQPVTSWRMDTPRLKSEQPQIYAAYAKQSVASKLEVIAQL